MKQQVYTKKTLINVPAQDLFAWHERDGAIQRLTPPWAPLQLLSRKGEGVKKGVKVSFRLNIFKIPMIWKAEHIGYTKNKEFKDIQTAGPFSEWIHTHRFIPEDDQSTIMEDDVAFKLPFGFLSWPFYSMAKRDMNRMFNYRHRVLKSDLEHHVNKTPAKRILISGASGTIGSILIPFLKACGHDVVQLVRHSKELAKDQIFWDPYNAKIDLKSTDHFDAVINLNGVDISKGNWSQDQKKKIVDSRVIPTVFLSNVIANMKHKPEVFISSSAIGLYGDQGDTRLTEQSRKGDCFISYVCDEWEKAADVSIIAGIRTVQLRIGVVLTPAGGALKRMAPAFQFGCGVRLSHGRQYMSWISMEDALSGILHILNHPSINGPVNLTAPNPVPNKEFSDILASVFNRKVYFTMPKWVASILWGQMGQETLLASARVLPQKLLDTGFSFQHKTLLSALKTMLGR